MHHAPLRPIELFRHDPIAFDQRAKTSAQRQNNINPDRDRYWINDRVVKYHCRGKAIPQFLRHQQRGDDDRIVPDIESAAEDLRNDRRQRGDEKAVATRARRNFVC